MGKNVILAIAAMIFVSGCSVNQDFKYFTKNLDKEPIKKEVSDKEYEAEKRFEWKIQQGDRVQINVYNQSASSAGGKMASVLDQSAVTFVNRNGTEGLLVPADGNIYIPLIGKVKITGLTENEAAEKLTKEYKKYLRNPFVSVKILNQKLIVLGEVKAPGVVPVTSGTMTLFEALAATGDLTEDAMRNNIIILRGDLRHPQFRQVDLTDIGAIKLTSLILRPNDIVYVQPRSMKAINKVFTEQSGFFNFLNTIMSPFLTYKAIDESYRIGVTATTGK